MYKRFSIKKAFSDGFECYAKHYGLVLPTLAMVIVNSLFIPVVPNINFFDLSNNVALFFNSQDKIDKIIFFIKNYGQKSILIIFLSCVFLFVLNYLTIGYSRLSLNADKEKLDPKLIITSVKDCLTFIAIQALWLCYTAIFLIFLTLVVILLLYLGCPFRFIFFLGVIIFCFYLSYIMDFIFTPYVLAEKSQSISSVLDKSKKIIMANKLKFIGFCLAFSLVFFLINIFIQLLTMFLKGSVTTPSPVDNIPYYFIAIPLSTLIFASIYKQLK